MYFWLVEKIRLYVLVKLRKRLFPLRAATHKDIHFELKNNILWAYHLIRYANFNSLSLHIALLLILFSWPLVITWNLLRLMMWSIYFVSKTTGQTIQCTYLHCKHSSNTRLTLVNILGFHTTGSPQIHTNWKLQSWEHKNSWPLFGQGFLNQLTRNQQESFSCDGKKQNRRKQKVGTRGRPHFCVCVYEHNTIEEKETAKRSKTDRK